MAGCAPELISHLAKETGTAPSRETMPTYAADQLRATLDRGLDTAEARGRVDHPERGAHRVRCPGAARDLDEGPRFPLCHPDNLAARFVYRRYGTEIR